MQALEALKADIDRGLADVAASRVRAVDVERILERGRKPSATRASSS
jgi:antitoxin ParD1/3/4